MTTYETDKVNGMDILKFIHDHGRVISLDIAEHFGITPYQVKGG